MSLALIGLSRPTLAILNEDHPKVKNIESKQETNELLNFLITILNIKVSSKEEELQLDKQMILIFDLIKTKFGNLTIPEIKEAFKMYVAKEFADVKVFRLLDCVSVGEVLTAYIDFRNESLRVYDSKKRALIEAPPEVSEIQKNEIRERFLKSIFDELTEKGFSQNAWHLFEKLELSGKIKITAEDKKALYLKQLRNYEIEEKAEIRGKYTTNSKAFLRDLEDKIKGKGTIGSVVNRCRSITASNFLMKHISDFENFKKAVG
jgi:hypothetical protein